MWLECQASGASPPATGTGPAATLARRLAAASLSARNRRASAGSTAASARDVHRCRRRVPAPTTDEIGGGRDRSDARDHESPGHVVPGLPVHDLLEGREPARDALGPRPDPAPAALGRLLEHDRALPRRPQAGRCQVRPDGGRIGRDDRVDLGQGLAVRPAGVQAADAALRLPARLEVQDERGHAPEVFDRLLRPPRVPGGPDRDGGHRPRRWSAGRSRWPARRRPSRPSGGDGRRSRPSPRARRGRRCGLGRTTRGGRTA